MTTIFICPKQDTRKGKCPSKLVPYRKEEKTITIKHKFNIREF